jgi:hypothetical protein
MEEARITYSSVATGKRPGQYRVVVAPMYLSDAWQMAFLKVAKDDEAGRSLDPKIEGSTMTYQVLPGVKRFFRSSWIRSASDDRCHLRPHVHAPPREKRAEYLK